jgi:hypothetical protein
LIHGLDTYRFVEFEEDIHAETQGSSQFQPPDHSGKALRASSAKMRNQMCRMRNSYLLRAAGSIALFKPEAPKRARLIYQK